MANDYRKQTRPERGGFFHQCLLLSMAFFCGYLSASLLDVHQAGTWIKAHIFSGQPQQAVVKNPHQRTALPRPKFEFYTLLTKEQTVKPTIPVIPLENKQVTASPESVSKKAAYLVQVASFRKKEDADRMKADLILKGFDVRVTSVQNEQLYWHRVLIGPFDTRTQAEKVRVSLARNEHLSGMIRKMEA